MDLQDTASREIGHSLISKRCRAYLRFADLRLYDQGQLLQVYLDGYLLSKNPLLLSTVHDIAEYLVNDALAHKDGGFYSAEDADSLPTLNSHEKKGAAVIESTHSRGCILCLD